MENLLIYGSIFDMLDELTNEEAGLLFKALNSFRKGEVVELEDRYLKGIWKGILPNLNKLKENYDSKVKSNQENGKKGGRPKGTSTTTKKEEITDTKIPEPIQDIQKDIIIPETEDLKVKNMYSEFLPTEEEVEEDARRIGLDLSSEITMKKRKELNAVEYYG